MKKRATFNVVGIALVLLFGLALFILKSGDRQTPEQEGQRGHTQCAQGSDCEGQDVCCEGVCVAQCLDNPPTPQAGREVQRPKVLTRQERSTALRLPARSRDVSLKPTELGPDECREDGHCAGSMMRCDVLSSVCQEPDICLNDQDCNGERVCQYGRCVDEVEGCRLQDCMPSGYCHSGFMQCEKHNCQTDEDCAGTRRCDPNQNLCVDCLEDAHCPGGAECTPGWYCQPKGGCGGDGDCDEGLCDFSRKRCHTAPCVDDEYEDNDKWSTARPLDPGDYDMVACPGDNDHFKFELSKGEGLVAQANFNNRPGMIELRLLDVNGVEIWRAGDSKLTGDVTLVWPRAEKDSLYTLRVLHRYGIGVPYNLSLTIIPEGICHNDKYEPNNRSSQATTLLASARWSMRLCGTEDDWVKQSLKAGQEARVLIDVSDGEVPRIDVFRDDEKKAFWSDDTLRRQKVIPLKGAQDADYYIRVSPSFPRSETMYGIRIDPVN